MLIDSQYLLILFLDVNQALIRKINRLLHPTLYPIEGLLGFCLSIEALFDDLIIVHTTPSLLLRVITVDALFEAKETDFIAFYCELKSFCLFFIASYALLVFAILLPVGGSQFFLRVLRYVEQLLFVIN